MAGLILNVVHYVLWGVLFAKDLAGALQAMGKSPAVSLVPLFIVLDFLYGITLVYLYAAIRPRYGPGPKTAICAGLIMWVIAALLRELGEAPFGVLPMRLYLVGVVVSLVLMPVAAVAGARFYSEAQLTASSAVAKGSLDGCCTTAQSGIAEHRQEHTRRKPGSQSHRSSPPPRPGYPAARIAA